MISLLSVHNDFKSILSLSDNIRSQSSSKRNNYIISMFPLIKKVHGDFCLFVIVIKCDWFNLSVSIIDSTEHVLHSISKTQLKFNWTRSMKQIKFWVNCLIPLIMSVIKHCHTTSKHICLDNSLSFSLKNVIINLNLMIYRHNVFHCNKSQRLSSFESLHKNAESWQTFADKSNKPATVIVPSV